MGIVYIYILYFIRFNPNEIFKRWKESKTNQDFNDDIMIKECESCLNCRTRWRKVRRGE